jgi:hypothetical protein
MKQKGYTSLKTKVTKYQCFQKQIQIFFFTLFNTFYSNSMSQNVDNHNDPHLMDEDDEILAEYPI